MSSLNIEWINGRRVQTVQHVINDRSTSSNWNWATVTDWRDWNGIGTWSSLRSTWYISRQYRHAAVASSCPVCYTVCVSILYVMCTYLTWATGGKHVRRWRMLSCPWLFNRWCSPEQIRRSFPRVFRSLQEVIVGDRFRPNGPLESIEVVLTVLWEDAGLQLAPRISL